MVPEPLFKVPAESEAVNPVTPVELTFCVLKDPPFPPVYGIVLITPLATTPADSVPEFKADEQFNVEIEPGQVPPVVQVNTPLHKVKTCPFNPGFKFTQDVPFQ